LKIEEFLVQKMLIEKSKPKRCYAYFKPYITHNNQFTINFVPHTSFIGILEKQNTSWGVDPLYRVRTYVSMRKTFLNFKIKLKIQLNFYVQKIIQIRE
jgi:hypothetical protein